MATVTSSEAEQQFGKESFVSTLHEPSTGSI